MHPEHKLLLEQANCLTRRICGSMLPGMVHNANNFCHIINMQIELLKVKMESRPETTLEEQKKKLDRIASGSRQLMELLAVLNLRQTYVGTEKTQVEPLEYLQWLVNFWQNDLTFKHKIRPEISILPDTPNLALPPMVVTHALEDFLLRGVALAETWEKDQLPCLLEAGPYKNGARFTISMPDEPGVDPVDEKQKKNLQNLVQALGWEFEEKHQAPSILFTLKISEQKSGF
jgi:hypothetical protein